jgi:protein TonB
MFVTRLSVIYGGSLLLHAGVALAVAAIHAPVRREPTKIAIQEVKRSKPPAKQPEPPPVVPAPNEAVQPKPAAPKKAAPKAPKPTAAEPAAAASTAGASVPDFGLTLGGATGGGGVAVPAPSQAAPATLKTTKAAPKTLRKVPASSEASCLEELVKPKPITIPQPQYPAAARAEGIAGKVRVELSVDEQGQVVSARVLEGLGHGLDDAALEAARAAHFEPATRCGKPTKTTFVIGMRFAL